MNVENSDFLRVLGNGQAGTLAMAAAYGCALSGKGVKDKPINLLPLGVVGDAPQTNWIEEKKALKQLATKEMLVVIAVLFVLYVLSYFVILGKRAGLDRSMAAYPSVSNATIREPLEAIQVKSAAANEQYRYLANLINKRPFFTSKLDQLVRMVPRHIRLSVLRYSDLPDRSGNSSLSLHLEGYMRSDTGGEFAAINKFVSQLTANKDFMQGLSSVRISSTKKTVLNDAIVTKFSLDCVTSVRA
jgi:hypothetical protein